MTISAPIPKPIKSQPAHRIECGSTRIKFLSRVITSGSRGWAEHYSTSGPVFLRMGNLDRKSIDLRLDELQRVTPPPGAEIARTRAQEGDVLVSVTAFIGTTGIVPAGLGEAYVNQHTALVRPDTRKVWPRWMAYCLFSEHGQAQFRELVQGGAKEGIGLEDVGHLTIPTPPVETQRSLSAFLDGKTAELDEVIAKKQRLIQLLSEKIKRVIFDAVTKGLDPHVPLRDSGVEWIGVVPQHWDVKMLKHESRVARGASPRPIDDPKYFDNDGEYAWVRIADVSAAGVYLTQTTQRLSKLGSELSVKMQPGDLFLSIAGTVGKPCIARIKCCIHDGFVYFPDRKAHRKFLYYVFATGEAYGGLGKLGTQLNLNTDSVGGIRLPFPPLAEQEAISNFIDDEISRLQSFVEMNEQQIDKLREYRQTLISAAVTGRISLPWAG